MRHNSLHAVPRYRDETAGKVERSGRGESGRKLGGREGGGEEREGAQRGNNGEKMMGIKRNVT